MCGLWTKQKATSVLSSFPLSFPPSLHPPAQTTQYSASPLPSELFRNQTYLKSFFLFLQFSSKLDIRELKQNFMLSPWNKTGSTKRLARNDCPSQKVCSFLMASSIAFHLDITEIRNQGLLHSSDQLWSFRTAAPALPTQTHCTAHESPPILP